jgi:hypothetical protein
VNGHTTVEDGHGFIEWIYKHVVKNSFGVTAVARSKVLKEIN